MAKSASFVKLLIALGSLYVLSLSAIRWIGVITPIGESLCIVSWIMLALCAFKSDS